MIQVPLSDIDIGEEEIKSVENVLKSKWLSMGPVTQKFEHKFANYLGIKHAFGVSNGTAALHLANKVIGVNKGDEVIVPSLTFVATANSVLYCGAKPVFADITSKEDFNISPDSILEKISKKTKAIIVVHYGGYSCNMDAITEIAEDNNLKIIEDVAHAPGAEFNGKKCGTIGEIGCFSFFSNKNLATGEGGMIVTNDSDMAKKIRIMRSHSMNTLTWDRHKGHAYSYDVNDIGFNYRINEIASSIGIIQLEKLDYNNSKRRIVVENYIKNLKKISEIHIPFTNQKGTFSYHIFPIILSKQISRYDLMDELKNKGIQTSIHYPPIHLFTYYKKLFDYNEGMLPKTEFVGNNTISLPLYSGMSDNQIKMVLDSIITIMNNE